MRKLWKSVLVCIGLLLAVPLVSAQQQSTSPTKPSAPKPADTKPSSAPKSGEAMPQDSKPMEPKAEGAKVPPGTLVPVIVDRPNWTDMNTFWLMCLLVAVLGVIFIYYAFVRKKAE